MVAKELKDGEEVWAYGIRYKISVWDTGRMTARKIGYSTEKMRELVKKLRTQ